MQSYTCLVSTFFLYFLKFVNCSFEVEFLRDCSFFPSPSLTFETFFADAKYLCKFGPGK